MIIVITLVTVWLGIPLCQSELRGERSPNDAAAAAVPFTPKRCSHGVTSVNFCDRDSALNAGAAVIVFLFTFDVLV